MHENRCPAAIVFVPRARRIGVEDIVEIPLSKLRIGIEQMLRVYRWGYNEKRRTLEDLLRLADRLRADMGRLDAPSAATGDGQSTDQRSERLVRSVVDIEATI